MKKILGALILCLFTLCLSACSILNFDTGPCYGMGCPAFSPKQGAPAQQTAAQNTDGVKTHKKVAAKNAATPGPQTKGGE